MKIVINKLKSVFAIALVLCVFSSCEDYLSPEPTTPNAETFFKTAADFDLAVLNMYDGIAGLNSTNANDNHATQVEFYITEMRSDNTETKSQEGEAAQFESYSIAATNGIVDDYYRSFYDVIFRANTILDNLSVLSEPAKYEAEAKFVRGYAYFNLVRLFGDIPLINSVISPGDTDTQFARVATATVYELIVSDLTTAIAGLDNTYKNRGSKAGAQGLLAKVHLTLGNYTEAQTLCEAVITTTTYSLEADFNDVFYSELNGEIIFAISYAEGSGLDSQNFSAEWLNGVGRTSGVNYVTDNAKAFIDALDVTDTRKVVSYRNDVGQPTKNQVAKFLPTETLADKTTAGNDWIVLRYADILLMRAEAILAGGEMTTNATALTSINAVRTRAGVTALTEITKETLLNERRAELTFENQRFYDLVRFGKAQSVLSAFSTANNYSYNATDLLLPIPQREINLSIGVMKQNPGY